jgi:hypothetical protein
MEDQQHFDRTERFLGRLEQAIQLYNRADQSSPLREEIARLRTEISKLQGTISEGEIRRKLTNASRRFKMLPINLYRSLMQNGLTHLSS